MFRRNTNPDTLRNQNPVELAIELTHKSVEGFACTDIRSRRGTVEATLAPAPVGEPYRLYRAIPWNRFWQPDGWDYAFSDGTSHYYISYPLPAGTVAERSDFTAEENFAEEQAFLADHARNGLHLVAMQEDIYFFLPAEPTETNYTVAESRRPLLTGTDNWLPPATEPDTEGRYFLTFGIGNRAYFADSPSRLSPRVGQFPDYDTFRTAFDEYHSGSLRKFWTILAGSGMVGSILFILLTFFEDSRSFSWKGMGVSLAVLAGLLALIFLIGTLCIRHRDRQTLARIQSEVDYPRTLPSQTPRDIPAIPDADEASRLRALKNRCIMHGLTALFLTVVFVMTLYTFFFNPDTMDNLTWVDGIIALLCAPFAIVCFAARFFSLFRKIRSMKKESHRTDDPD